MTCIDEIRERLDKARPGPWSAKSEQRVVYVFAGDERLAGVGMDYDKKAVANAELIANAPADLAWCIEYIEELEWVLRGKGLNPTYFTPENTTKN